MSGKAHQILLAHSRRMLTRASAAQGESLRYFYILMKNLLISLLYLYYRFSEILMIRAHGPALKPTKFIRQPLPDTARCAFADIGSSCLLRAVIG